MDSFGFKEILIVFQVFITWLLVFFLITNKNKKYLSNVLLALFLLFYAQDSSGLISLYLLYPKYPGLGMLLNSTVFLLYPTFYLYVLSVTNKSFKLNKTHWIHLSFFLLNFILFIPSYYSVDFQSKIDFLTYNDSIAPLEIKISYLLVHIQIPIYLLISYLEIKKHRTLVLENYSDVNPNYYKWIIQLIILFGFEFLMGTFKNIVRFSGDDTVYLYLSFTVTIASLGMICWIVLKVMRSPELFRGIDMSLKSVKEIVDDKEQNQEYLDEIKKLKNYMEESEPYLEPSLSVYDLSKQLDMSSKELSILINHNLNQHFFDFVNRYRIEKAKELLISEERKNHTILEILYEVGFNTKSSFNTAFKKHTQVTPTFYRKNTIKKAS